MSGRGVTYTHPLFPRVYPNRHFGVQDVKLAKPLVWFSMAVLVWKTICTPGFFCFPLTHFHLLSSFSHLLLLCPHIKNKGFYITNFSSSILPKPKKPLWSHTFPSLSAYLTQMWKEMKNYGCSSRTDPIPVQHLPHAAHSISSQGLHWCFHSGTLQLILQLILWAAFNIPDYFSLSLCSPLSATSEETGKCYPLSPYTTLHPFLGNHNILKHLHSANVQVSHLCKPRFHPISNRSFTCFCCTCRHRRKRISVSTFPSHSTCCYHLSVTHCLAPALWPDNSHAFCQKHASALQVKSPALNSTFLGPFL